MRWVWFVVWMCGWAVASASTLLEVDFASDVSAFGGAGFSHSTAAGADYQPGVMLVDDDNNSGTPDRAVITFEPQSTGHTVVSFWVNVTDAENPSDNSRETYVYLLESSDNPNTITSGDSLVAIVCSRRTTNGATATRWRTNHSGTTGHLLRRSQWHHIAVDIDHANTTYDWYQDGRLVTAGLSWQNTNANDIGQIVVLNVSAAATSLIDNLRVESTPDGIRQPSDLILSHDFTTGKNGEIETLYPDLDKRSLYPQPWKAPDNTASWGCFTVGANGAAPDADSECGTLVRGTSECVVELDCTAAGSGTIGASVLARVWAGLDGDSYLELQYDKSDTGDELELLQGTASLADVTPDDNASVTAGSDYTLKMVCRGRVIECYFNGTLEFTHTITGDATGARGQYSEEHVGFRIDTRTAGMNLGATNYVRAIRVYGELPTRVDSAPSAFERRTRVVDVGEHIFCVEAEGLLEFYPKTGDLPFRNHCWSKGMQFMHFSEADPNKESARYQSLYAGPQCVAWESRFHNLREDAYLGFGGYCFVTITPRGIYVREGVDDYVDGSENHAPDHDFRTELWSDTIYGTGRTAAGSKSSNTVVKGFADWAASYTSSQAVACQAITTGTNKTLVTMATVLRDGDLPDDEGRWTHKRVGNLDPFSVSIGGTLGSDLSAGDAFACSRLYMPETGASVAASDAFREALLDDLEQPATWIASIGTSSGFDLEHGWYEATQASGAWVATLDGVTARVRPQIHFDAATQPGVVLVDGALQTLGTDYWWAADGAGGGVLGFTATLAADATVIVAPRIHPILSQR